MAELSLAEAQAHAEAVDAWLGLRVDETERRLIDEDAGRAARASGQEIWLERGPRVFLTPYTEIRAMLERASRLEALGPGARVVDLGSGYARMGFVLARHFPEAQFVGYELVEARAREGERVLRVRGCERARSVAADLAASTFAPEEADLYFIYDYGARPAIEKTLGDLRGIASRRSIAVVGRGRSSRDAIEREEPWLSQVVAPVHAGNWSIYRTSEGQTPR